MSREKFEAVCQRGSTGADRHRLRPRRWRLWPVRWTLGHAGRRWGTTLSPPGRGSGRCGVHTRQISLLTFQRLESLAWVLSGVSHGGGGQQARATRGDTAMTVGEHGGIAAGARPGSALGFGSLAVLPASAAVVTLALTPMLAEGHGGREDLIWVSTADLIPVTPAVPCAGNLAGAIGPPRPDRCSGGPGGDRHRPAAGRDLGAIGHLGARRLGGGGTVRAPGNCPRRQGQR